MQKAAENEALALTLDLNIHSAPNWGIVMIFYAAMHHVEAYFFTQGVHNQLHPTRDSAIQRDNKIKAVWRAYARLKDASEHARYESAFFTANQFQLMRANLNSIKAVIIPLI